MTKEASDLLESKSWLDAHDLCVVLEVSLPTIRRLSMNPEADFPPSRKIGHARRWRADVVKAYILRDESASTHVVGKSS